MTNTKEHHLYYIFLAHVICSQFTIIIVKLVVFLINKNSLCEKLLINIMLCIEMYLFEIYDLEVNYFLFFHLYSGRRILSMGYF